MNAAVLAQAVDIRKRIATLQARCALAGWVAEVIELDSGRPALIVTKGPITRRLESIAEAEAWLESEAEREASSRGAAT